MNLQQCETIINDGLNKLYDMGKALEAIKSEKLYKPGYKTFDEYCLKRWDLSYKRVHQIIQHARTVDKISTVVDVSPETERQTRELNKSSDPVYSWQKAREETGKEQPTSRDISNVINFETKEKQEEYDAIEGQKDEETAIIDDLMAENKLLKEKLTIGAYSKDYQVEVNSELSSLRAKVEALTAQLRATEAARDRLLSENAKLRSQVFAQRSELGRLQA